MTRSAIVFLSLGFGGVVLAALIGTRAFRDGDRNTHGPLNPVGELQGKIARPRIDLAYQTSRRLDVTGNFMRRWLGAVESGSMSIRIRLNAGDYRLLGSRQLDVSIPRDTIATGVIGFKPLLNGTASSLIGPARWELSSPGSVAGAMSASSEVLVDAMARSLVDSFTATFADSAPSGGTATGMSRLLGDVRIESVRLSLREGATLPAGGSMLRLAKGCTVTFGNVSLGPGGVESADCRLNLSLAGGTELSLGEVRVRPESGVLDWTGRIRATDREVTLVGASGGSPAGAHGPTCVLHDVGITGPAGSGLVLRAGTMRLERAAVDFACARGSGEGTGTVQLAARIDDAATTLPLAGGSWEARGISVPRIEIGGRLGSPGATGPQWSVIGPVSVGAAAWSGRGPTGDIRIESRGGILPAPAATAGRTAIDLSPFFQNVSRLVLTDRSKKQVSVRFAPDARLGVAGPVVVDLQGPAASQRRLPDLSFKGPVPAAAVDFGKGAFACRDAVADLSLRAGPDTGGVSLAGSVRGNVPADGVPLYLAALAKLGTFRPGEMGITFPRGASAVGFRGIEVRVPKETLLGLVRGRIPEAMDLGDFRVGDVGAGDVTALRNVALTHLSVANLRPVLSMSGDEFQFTASPSLQGRMESAEPHLLLGWEPRTIQGPFGTRATVDVLVRDVKWVARDPSPLSGTVSVGGTCRVSLVGGERLCDRRIALAFRCDSAHIDEADIGKVPAPVRAAFRLLASDLQSDVPLNGKSLDDNVRDVLTRTIELDPFPASVRSLDRDGWLERISVKSLTMKADGDRVVLTGEAEVR